jgi:hypothetical protein
MVLLIVRYLDSDIINLSLRFINSNLLRLQFISELLKNFNSFQPKKTNATEVWFKLIKVCAGLVYINLLALYIPFILM